MITADRRKELLWRVARVGSCLCSDLHAVWPGGTSQAGAGVQQRNALTRDEVPNPGNWTWHIAIGNVRDLPVLLAGAALVLRSRRRPID